MRFFMHPHLRCSLTTPGNFLLRRARSLPSDPPRLSHYVFYPCAPFSLSHHPQSHLALLPSPSRKLSNSFFNVPSISLYIFLALKISPVSSSHTETLCDKISFHSILNKYFLKFSCSHIHSSFCCIPTWARIKIFFLT